MKKNLNNSYNFGPILATLDMSSQWFKSVKGSPRTCRSDFIYTCKVNSMMIFWFVFTGTIPGPIVYGLFIDKSCLIWEYTCDGYATCWLYDNKLFAHSFLLVTLVMKILSLIFFAVAIFCYKPSKSEILEQDLEPQRESGIELSLSNDDVNRAYDVL